MANKFSKQMFINGFLVAIALCFDIEQDEQDHIADLIDAGYKQGELSVIDFGTGIEFEGGWHVIA